MIAISFNWASLLFYCTFISYGYFAAMSDSFQEATDNPLLFVLKNIILAGILFIFGYCANHHKDFYEDKINLSYWNFISIFFIATLLLLIGEDLTTSLTDDEIAYSLVSLAYPEYISRIFISMTPIFDNYQYAFIVQFFSLVIVLSFIFLFYFLNKLSFNKRIFIFIIIFIAIRLLVTYVHGNSFPHPPMNLLPTLIFGTFFSIDDITLKLSFFIGYLVYLLIVNRMLSRNYNQFISCILTLCIASIPLFFNFAFRVDHSLWGGTAITLVLLELVTAKQLNYIRIFSFISIFSMFRMPVFIAVVPLFLHYGLSKINSLFFLNKDKAIKEVILVLLPLLLFIPFLINSILFDTPSTLSNNGFFANFILAAKSGVILKTVIFSVSTVWIVLAIPSLFFSSKKNTVIIFCFFLLLILTYFSIYPERWGHSKYQMEWFLPFSIIGFVLVFDFLKKIRINDSILVICLILLIIFNFNQYKALLKNQYSTDDYTSNFKEITLDSISFFRTGYNYKAAYEYLINNNLESSTYSVGITYGVFPELLNNYLAKNYRHAYNNYEAIDKSNKINDIQWTSANHEIVNLNKRINYLLVGYVIPNKDEFIKSMFKKGWSTEKEFYNMDYKSTIYLLKRN